MASPSYTQINYSVRPNKNVQRKLIADLCMSLRPEFPIEAYRYVGMGSMWFSDFILMHKLLGIKDMVSIEKESWQRAMFNQPYKCITVKEGTTTDVLPTLNWTKRSVVWLDYDYEVRPDVLEDLQILAQHLSSGSVVIATCNAEIDRFKEQGDREKAIPSKIGVQLRSLLPKTPQSNAWSKEGFPEIVSEILFNQLDWAVANSGRKANFRPLISFFYSDGTRMVTVGGMIVNDVDRARLESNLEQTMLDFINGRRQHKINVPPLTPKEKYHLDRHFPCKKPPRPGRLKFPLDEEQLQNYWRYYRQYPLFSEMAP